MLKRILFFVYGSVCYLIFFGTFLYAIGFIGNFLVGRTLDGAPGTSVAYAVIMDAVLLTLFAVQHSIMARRSRNVGRDSSRSRSNARRTFFFRAWH